MLRSLTVALCLLASPVVSLCGGASFAGRLTTKEVAEIAAKRANTPYAQGIIWTATRDDTTLTILGTMHLRDQRLGALMDTVRADLLASDIVLLEATPAEEAQVMAYMTSNPDFLFSTNGPTLPDQLPEEIWQSLSEAARARGIPPILASKMQPWYLMMAIGIPVCAMADLAENKRGLDQLVIQDAQANDVPMQALEPFDTIFTIMRGDTRAEQIKMLEIAAFDAELQQQMFVAMLDSYFEGDVAGLLAMSQIAARRGARVSNDEIAKLTAEAEQALLYDRNLLWLPVIEAVAQDHDTIMIAVGAGHLPGQQGLLNLLVDNGWQITPR